MGELTTSEYLKEVQDVEERGSAGAKKAKSKKTKHQKGKSAQSNEKGKTKANQNKQRKAVTDEEKDPDNYCAYCDGYFFDDSNDESWIQCQACKSWFHEECTGAFSKTVFTCDVCRKSKKFGV